MVLVLESDDALREAIVGALEVAVSAVGAGTGREALALLEQVAPSIVLLNVQVRDMDGLEFLRHVRCRLPDTKVIVTSDSGDYRLVQRVIEMGIGDFLEKPFGIGELLNSLDNSVRGVSLRLDDRILAARYHEKSRLRRQTLLVAS